MNNPSLSTCSMQVMSPRPGIVSAVKAGPETLGYKAGMLH